MEFTSDMVNRQEIEDLSALIETAQGKRPATLLLKNCRLVNVYSEEIYETDIAIYQNKIASITKGAVTEAEEVIDCEGNYVMPGFIDPHMHVDTTMLWPDELARVLVPLGTTTVFVDMTNVVHNGGIAAAKELAVRCIEKNQGGFAVVKDGEVMAEVRLPIGGIMSSEPYEMLLKSVDEANEAAHQLGCPLVYPFFTMSQTVLSSLPDLGFTDLGIVDVASGKIVDVLI